MWKLHRVATIVVVFGAVSSLTVPRVGTAGDPPQILAAGEWSKAVADSRGYAVRGRLVLCEKPHNDRRREVAVYVELQDARESVGGEPTLVYCEFGKTDFRPESKKGLTAELSDKNRQPIKTEPFVFGGAVPQSEWVTLPSDATIRLRASPFGIHRSGAIAIAPSVASLWVIGEDDLNEHFLSGTFTVDPAADLKPSGPGHVWRGTIDLPAARIAGRKKPQD